MANLKRLGPYFLAIPMIAFGVQHFLYGDFVTRVAPKLPSWIPGQPILAYLAGAALVVAGIALILRIRLAASLLGAALILSGLLLHVPLAVAAGGLGGLWTNAGKALAMAGGALLLSESFAERATTTSPIQRSLDRLIPLGPYLFSAFLILCGIQHFLFPEFVKTLVPAWIPGNLFWTYFAGVALIAGGAGILVPITTRQAANLTGIMIFLWLILLHIPRALADLHNSNETTAVFEAFAMSGIAFLIAWRTGQSQPRSRAAAA